MQFTSGGRFIGNVAEGKITLYRKAASAEKKPAARRERSAG
jgi:hypothetical protein